MIKVCPKCNKEKLTIHTFCEVCGNQLEGVKGENECKCGSTFNKGDKFCWDCGQNLSKL